MKKIILTLAAAASIVSCSKDITLEVVEKSPIAFGNTFVDNSTKAIDNTITTATLSEFKVYGSVTGTGTGEKTVNIFDGITVSKADDNASIPSGSVNDGLWYYLNTYTQYWINGNNYKFAAVVNADAESMTFDKDANNKDNLPLTITYDASTQKDLLYAEHSKLPYSTGNATTVAFSFNHLLSKVHFTFTNTMTDNTADRMYQYRISNVKITNAFTNGTYTINGAKWEASGNRTNVEFGHISNQTVAGSANTAVQVGAVGKTDSATSHNAMLLVPNNYTDLQITCKIETLLNNQVIDTEETHTINGVSANLQAGNAYNFVITKGNPGEPIKFSVQQVNTWTPDTATNVTVGTL